MNDMIDNFLMVDEIIQILLRKKFYLNTKIVLNKSTIFS